MRRSLKNSVLLLPAISKSFILLLFVVRRKNEQSYKEVLE